jgi:hypothetical protein
MPNVLEVPRRISELWQNTFKYLGEAMGRNTEETHQSKVLSDLATSLLDGLGKDGHDAGDEAALALKAGELLKTATEINKLEIEARALTREQWRFVLGLVVPVATTLILAVTLVRQNSQFAATARQQADAEEDSRLNDAAKALPSTTNLGPVILVETLLKSPRYKELARSTAIQLLPGTDSQVFPTLFSSVFWPPRWEDLPALVQVDRALARQLFVYLPIEKRLTPQESIEESRLIANLGSLGSHLGQLFRSPRPEYIQDLDLRDVHLWDSDLSQAKLKRADMRNFALTRGTLKDADLSEVVSFDHSTWKNTAWWQARQVSPALLKHLIEFEAFKPDESKSYPGGTFTEADYDAAIKRLLGGK